MEILPYYYPTTVQFVDDNRRFLANLTLDLDESLAYQLYDSPTEALEFVSIQAKRRSAVHRSFARLIDVSERPPSDYALHISIADLAAETKNRRRFSDTSVAVVDFDMGGMNGLELCERYKSFGLKTILLTGVADERDAVSAFNQGIIDTYIRKSDLQVHEALNQAIGKFQHVHFQESVALLTAALKMAKFDLLVDPGFGHFFRDLCQRHRFIEHYLLPGRLGFLLLTDKGQQWVLLVQTDSQLREHHKIAVEEKAPKQLISSLEKRQVIPYSYSEDGYFRRNFPFLCFAASPLQTMQRQYYWALVENPPFLRIKSEETFSYEMYLKQLDEFGQFSWR